MALADISGAVDAALDFGGPAEVTLIGSNFGLGRCSWAPCGST